MTEREDLIGDWSFMKKIDAKPSNKKFEPVPILVCSKATINLRSGKSISLMDAPEEWVDLPIFLDEQSLPFVFYISDQPRFISRFIPLYREATNYKFHFRWCFTLEMMRESGRIQRYRAKYDICNPMFEVNDGKQKKKLKVCLNCCKGFRAKTLTLYNYFDAGRNDIEEKFHMPKFFEKFGKIDLPLSAHPGGTDGYVRNWPDVARRVKEKARWKCLDCKQNFGHDRKNMHVHHISGVKSDNVDANLEVVCRPCHAKKPGHEHMR